MKVEQGQIGIKKAISKAILRMAGQKLGPVDSVDLPRCVACVAPYTSDWDFTVGRLSYISVGRDVGFLIKKEWFLSPFNLLFNWLGGVPVDRDKYTSVTDQMVEHFKTSERFQLAVTPEGTRKRIKERKKGFYFIALKANAPIAVAYFDYGKKEVDMKDVFYPTGNVDKDIHTMREIYRGAIAYHPENFAQVQKLYGERIRVLLQENKSFPQEKQEFYYEETTVSSP